MKKFFLSFIFAMLICLLPCVVYAGPLDAVTETQGVENELGFSITSGVDLSKGIQSTFDSSRTISGTAEQGTEITIHVSTKDASGEVKGNNSYDMEVGASGLFSQTLALGIGENTVSLSACKAGYKPISQSVVIKRKKMEIKMELESTISIPGSVRTSLFTTK